MSHPSSVLRNLCCTVTLVTNLACGGSVPAANTSDSAADSPRAENAAADASASDASVTASAEKAATPGGTEALEADTNAKTNVAFRFSATGNLLLNDLQLLEKGAAAKLAEQLGAPTREKVYRSGEKGLFHDEEGVVFWTVDGEVSGVGVNFNWDGDEKFPETPFTGTLELGGLAVDRSTTPAQFASLKGYSVSCLGDSMCGGKSEHTQFVAGFEKGVVTQVAFLPLTK